MTQRALTDSEVIDFADQHSGTLAMSPGRINPYKIGIELFREIEDRWNKGKFGKEYDECDDRTSSGAGTASSASAARRSSRSGRSTTTSCSSTPS